MTGLPDACDAAFKIAERRVRGCYVNHKAKGHMFEKASDDDLGEAPTRDKSDRKIGPVGIA